jgi:hypothetical protein
MHERMYVGKCLLASFPSAAFNHLTSLATASAHIACPDLLLKSNAKLYSLTHKLDMKPLSPLAQMEQKTPKDVAPDPRR